MRRCVIIGGAGIDKYEQVRNELRTDDFFVFCDSGLKHMEGLGVKPDLIVGDFDSHEKPDTDVETIVLPREKDDTDTFFAAKEMVRRGYEEFLLVGVIGARLDHTLGNLSILFMLDTAGKSAEAIDDYSEIEVVSARSGKPGKARIEDSYPYFSVLNLTGEAEGITIRNAKFPLENGQIDWDYQYAVSNEVLPGETAEISVAKGRVLLIKNF
ncbi:MAG: thiamine diphosphokinase [Clostridiales bacterium]|nr:thiamine diphosphokinase [Clostridiales bacterium]